MTLTESRRPNYRAFGKNQVKLRATKTTSDSSNDDTDSVYDFSCFVTTPYRHIRCLNPKRLKGETSEYDWSDPDVFGLLVDQVFPKWGGTKEAILSKVGLIFSGTCYAAVSSLLESTDHDLLRNKIQGFARLPTGWDTYDGKAPSRAAVEAALFVVAEIEKHGVLPKWVTPTSDATILMRYRHGDVWFEWEFHSDGDVALVRQPLFEKESYHDFAAGELASFFSKEQGVQ